MCTVMGAQPPSHGSPRHKNQESEKKAKIFDPRRTQGLKGESQPNSVLRHKGMHKKCKLGACGER